MSSAASQSSLRKYRVLARRAFRSRADPQNTLCKYFARLLRLAHRKKRNFAAPGNPELSSENIVSSTIPSHVAKFAAT